MRTCAAIEISNISEHVARRGESPSTLSQPNRNVTSANLPRACHLLLDALGSRAACNGFSVLVLEVVQLVAFLDRDAAGDSSNRIALSIAAGETCMCRCVVVRS
jgi:hypothetical protein